MDIWLWHSLQVVMIVVCTVLFIKMIQRCRRKTYEVPARDIKKGHLWVHVEMFSKPAYCCVSGSHIVEGYMCDCCGVCVDSHHMKQTNRNIPCKTLSKKNGGSLKHQWIKGNLPLCSRCCICQETCGVLPQLCDYRCCWCQRVVHEACYDRVSADCDLGQYSHMVVPPNCVQLKLVGLKGRRHLIVSSVKAPPVDNWQPLIVIANRRSGNNDGVHILREFRALLNPLQVIDVADIEPENGLEWCHLLSDITCRVLVCGGDGTVGWVLDAIDKLQFQHVPQVCILPLGTGNDLARVLGWGPGYSGDFDVSQILPQITASTVAKLDRWMIEVTPVRHFGIRLPKTTKIMSNYASIGVDAHVVHSFHKHRESRPYLFGNRLLNKFWYFTYGTKDVLERECKDLHKRIKVELDGKVIDLPELEGVSVLNISSWGGGCQPWHIGKNYPHDRYDDGLLEVIGIYSSFHMAQMQVSLAEPCRLGQAKTVKITLSRGKAPVQIDGEPWEQTPGVINISFHNQASVLCASPHDLSNNGDS